MWQEELQKNTYDIAISQMKRRLSKDLNSGMQEQKKTEKKQSNQNRDNQKEDAK